MTEVSITQKRAHYRDGELYHKCNEIRNIQLNTLMRMHYDKFLGETLPPDLTLFHI